MKIKMLFAFNNRFIVAAYTSILSLLKNANIDTNYEIIVMHDGLSAHNMQLLEVLIKKESKGKKHSISFINAKKIEELVPKGTSRSWPQIVYYRLFAADVIKGWDKLIFSDVDVIFESDLSEIWNLDLTGYDVAAIPSEWNDSQKAVMARTFEDDKKMYVYFAGFYIENLEHMRNTGWSKRLTENIKKYGDTLKMQDADLFTITSLNNLDLPLRYCILQSLYYNRDDIKKADEYYWLSNLYTDEQIEEEINNMAILHYAGKLGKPWRKIKKSKEYERYYRCIPLELKILNWFDIADTMIRTFVRNVIRQFKGIGSLRI